MKDLEGKLALVTGGAKGVGRVIVQRLAERGAHVIINYFHSHDAAKRAKEELQASGFAVDTIRASVAMKPQVEKMFQEIEARFGHLDILINNAASGALVPNDAVDEEHFSRALDTNLKGSFWCARHAAPLIARRGGGAIVNISSIGAGYVPANYLVVGTSKAALEALTRYLAVEYAPLNIRVNTASATLVEGDVARLFPRWEEMWKASIAHTPMGRLANAEDLAGVVMFLTSEQSRWVTGQVVLADGGLSLASVALSPPAEPTAPATIPLVSAAAPKGDATLAAHTTAGTEDHATAAGTADHAAAARIRDQANPVRSKVNAAPVRSEDHATGIADDAESEDIAIVGMGLAVPGASDPEEYWRVLMDGPDLFRQVPEDRWDFRSFYSPDGAAEDKSYQSRSVFITDFKPEAPLRDEIAGARTRTECTTLWLRHSLMQAMAGVRRKPGDRYSFAVGYTADGSQHLEEAAVVSGAVRVFEDALAGIAADEGQKAELLAGFRSVLEQRYWRGTGAVASYLPHNVGLTAMKGVLPEDTEVLMVDTACSSSLYAADLGIKGLLMGKHDVAVCGGSFAVGPRGSVLFAKLHGLSESGEVRPLDKDCDGVLFSDGAGVVVLKKLDRARADGDRILAVIKAFGASSDGKGKAIYAPSSSGQRLAIARAQAHPGVTLSDLDWVVAHATGTPAGDLAEFTTLREMIRTDHPVYVTSNKSLIGHTGWAAGVASLIEVVLGLQKQIIPPQHRFSAPPADFRIDEGSLRIPTTPIEWRPKPGRLRTAAISGFGFGGTNAHLVVSEYASDAKPASAPSRAYGDRIAIVAWAGHFPGLQSHDEVRAWLAGTGKAPEPSFGDFYPTPPMDKVRMPPPLLRALDRCQLMILECAHRLRDEVGAFWDVTREKTGVFLGHMGATRSATLYAARTYLDDVAQAVRQDERVQRSPILEEALTGFRRLTARLVPPSTENSFPGMMPNVIPARVANYFDLKGPNMTVDTGFSSSLSALEAAVRYLKSREVDMAVAGGINGNTTGPMRDLLPAALSGAPAEGVVLFALVRERTAVEAGLPVMAWIGDAAANAAEQTSSIECGAYRGAVEGLNYLAAEGAVAVARHLVAPERSTDIVCHEETHGRRLRLSLRAARPAAAPVAAAAPALAAASAIPEQFLNDSEYAAGGALAVSRNVATLEPVPFQRVRAEVPFFSPGTVVLTNTPDLLDRLGSLPHNPLVISTGPGGIQGAEFVHLREVTPESVQAACQRAGRDIRHMRVVTDLTAATPAEESLYAESPSLVALHDLTFLALKSCYDTLSKPGSSFVSLLMGAVPDGALHPFVGLFNGTVKSAAIEMRDALVLSVFTSTRDSQEAIRQAELETSAKQLLPTVVLDGTERKTFLLRPAPAELDSGSPARLDARSVIVATAGARGITAELLKTIARHFRPRLYLIGSNRLDDYAPHVFEGTDEEFARRRPAYLRERKAAAPELSVAAISREFDRMVAARTSRQNIAEMEKHCGKGAVHYLACDVLDRERLVRLLGEVVRTEGKIDLVINSAGLNRSSSIPVKTFADFKAVRDLKLRGYQNLRYALRSCLPSMWCNFGSFIGLTGQTGETDYSSGNDFLTSAAAYSSRRHGIDEYTIGWTLWSSVGLGSHPVFQTFLEKSGLYTKMTTEEGIHHFVREVNCASHPPSVVYMGPAEKAALTAYIPDYFAARERPAVDAAEKGTYYLGRVVSRTDDEIRFERTFSLETDPYLRHHLVNGYPTLPGTFVTEIAADAASQLAPGWKVVALEDAVFSHFLRVYAEGKARPKKIHARIVERRDDQVVAQVRVLTDITGPNGRLLATDKLHFQMNAVLRTEYPPAPVWEAWSPRGETAVPDPYHFASAPVRLTDMFVSTRNTRLHALGKRATWNLAVPPGDPVFSRFLVPSIMLDGLARIAVLNYVHGEFLPLVAPASIRRIDFYEPGNDCDLWRAYGGIDLYSTPRDFTFDAARANNRFVAARPDGTMVLQMKDVVGVVIGYIHAGTGEFVAPQRVNEMAGAALPAAAGAALSAPGSM